jgi:hypothetical protein
MVRDAMVEVIEVLIDRTADACRQHCRALLNGAKEGDRACWARNAARNRAATAAGKPDKCPIAVAPRPASQYALEV